MADQDVYAAAVAFLRGLGHDVVTATDLGMSSAADPDLLATAQADGRIFLTRDRDYGSLVFAGGSGGGVIYLRVLPSTVASVHAELARVLSQYPEAELLQSFVAVEPGRHRLRRPPPTPGP